MNTAAGDGGHEEEERRRIVCGRFHAVHVFKEIKKRYVDGDSSSQDLPRIPHTISKDSHRVGRPTTNLKSQLEALTVLEGYFTISIPKSHICIAERIHV